MKNSEVQEAVEVRPLLASRPIPEGLTPLVENGEPIPVETAMSMRWYRIQWHMPSNVVGLIYMFVKTKDWEIYEQSDEYWAKWTHPKRQHRAKTRKRNSNVSKLQVALDLASEVVPLLPAATKSNGSKLPRLLRKVSPVQEKPLRKQNAKSRPAENIFEAAVMIQKNITVDVENVVEFWMTNPLTGDRVKKLIVSEIGVHLVKYEGELWLLMNGSGKFSGYGKTLVEWTNLASNNYMNSGLRITGLDPSPPAP